MVSGTRALPMKVVIEVEGGSRAATSKGQWRMFSYIWGILSFVSSSDWDLALFWYFGLGAEIWALGLRFGFLGLYLCLVWLGFGPCGWNLGLVLGFGPWGWDLGLNAEIWESNLGFGPWEWDLGLEVGIWASRPKFLALTLGYGLWSWGDGGTKKEKFPTFVKV